MNEKLVDLLGIEANEIALSYEKSSIEGAGTPQEVADRREECFRKFLAKYFPFPFRIVKGNIVDSYGRKSNSIDCIILNPSHPYTIDVKNERASIIMADGVDYAVEIKSDLSSKTEIERALMQIQSVKKLRRIKHGLLFQNKNSDLQIECAKTVPGVIVADKTYGNLKLLIERIYEYYKKNEVPKIEQVDLILINNRCLIYNFRNDMYVTNDHSEGIAFWEGKEKCLAAFLYEINAFPHCEPMMSQSIMKMYLERVKPKTLKRFLDLDSKYLELR